MKKPCKMCNMTLHLENFAKCRNGKMGRNSRCRRCSAMAEKQRRANNPEACKRAAIIATNKWKDKNPLYRRQYYVKKRYGIDVNILMEYVADRNREQDGRCDICGIKCPIVGLVKSKDKRRLVIDHNHKTGQLRGLLCDLCNTALGKLREDTKIIRSMLTYIEKWNLDDKVET